MKNRHIEDPKRPAKLYAPSKRGGASIDGINS